MDFFWGGNQPHQNQQTPYKWRTPQLQVNRLLARSEEERDAFDTLDREPGNLALREMMQAWQFSEKYMVDRHCIVSFLRFKFHKWFVSKHLFERIKVFFSHKCHCVLFFSELCSADTWQGWDLPPRVAVSKNSWRGVLICHLESVFLFKHLKDLSPILRGFVTGPRSENSHEYPWISWNPIFHDLKLTSTAALEPGDLEIPQSSVFLNRQGWSTYSQWRRWGEKIAQLHVPNLCFAWLYSVCPPNKILRDI